MPISLRDLAERQGEVILLWYGDEVHIKYQVSRITKEFRALSLRMGREGVRIQRRSEELTARIRTVTAQDGTPEAKAEDAEAEKAIKQLQADDKVLKSQIDALVVEVVSSWDVMDGDKMLPITLATVEPLPPDFESAILMAIVNATSQGEAKAAPSTNDSPSI